MKANFVGIGEASRILGLSRTSLQKLVDSGQLPAFKTAGGHRRLPREAVDAVNQKMGPKAVLRSLAALPDPAAPRPQAPLPAADADGAGVMTVLVVEDDAATATLLASLFEQFYPEVKCLIATDGLDAVLTLERMRPRVLITDLKMQPFDGFRLLQLVSGRPEYQSVALVVISSLNDEEIARRGGLPSNVLFLRKPLNLDRLRGFFDAHLQLFQQMQGAGLSAQTPV